MTAFTTGFSNELVKLGAQGISPDAIRAILAGAGTGAMTGIVGNLINPSATPGGGRKNTIEQALKGAVIGGVTGFGGHHIHEYLKTRI
jgi:hypothetical protein